MGINAGVLHNAEPLTATRIAELEREIIENNKAFAFLDENSELCFATPFEPSGVKDLAWNNAYEIFSEQVNETSKVFVKNCFKKTGLKTFTHDGASLFLGARFVKNSWTYPQYGNNVGNTVYLYHSGLLVVLGSDPVVPPPGFTSSSVSALIIRKGIPTIEAGAFSDCTNLSIAKIPNSVSYIGSGAFYNCKKLTNIIIPDSVTHISNSAFSCSGLTSVTIPDNITTLGEGVFNGCSNLIGVVLPGTLNHIPAYFFQGCTSLSNIVFKGTKAQWQAIEKFSNWCTAVPATYVQCSDGGVPIQTGSSGGAGN